MKGLPPIEPGIYEVHRKDFDVLATGQTEGTYWLRVHPRGDATVSRVAKRTTILTLDWWMKDSIEHSLAFKGYSELFLWEHMVWIFLVDARKDHREWPPTPVRLL